MSGMVPSFVTGANAKIKAGGITMAYAQDVSYNTTVTTIPIETMGRYEVVSNEPVAYFVAGTLSVIRYTKIAQKNNMPGAASGGNGVGNWNYTTGGNASDGFNPGNLLGSKTWDLQIFQKAETDPAAGTSLPDTSPGTVTDTQMVVTLTDCRFTRKGGAINKRGVLVEQFSFNAILQSDDSYTSANSGDTDLS